MHRKQQHAIRFMAESSSNSASKGSALSNMYQRKKTFSDILAAQAPSKNLFMQNDTQRNKRVAAILALLALLTIVIVLISVFAIGGNSSASESSDDGVAISPASSLFGEGVKPAQALGLTEKALEPYADFYFFEKQRGERYLAFQEAHPELSAEQVVVRVNVDLDLPAYDSVTQVEDPSSLTALISKHHCFPYGYVPHDLVPFGEELIKAEVAAPLTQLIADAQADGVELEVASIYRSASTQDDLFASYVSTLGYEQASMQSAHGGYSEHQAGFAVDFGPTDYQFYDTPQEAWLKENAYRYGFIVRYEAGIEAITLYIHEPWHIRYVGTEVSTTMHEKGIASYEEYWVKYVQHTPPA